MDHKYLYINTIGCQMNVYDSERIAGVLEPLNYRLTTSIEKADLIIANTCAIREKAEQKVFSFLGRLARLKRRKPGLMIGVGGCVAQQEGKKILNRIPFIDIVFGTHAIGRLSGIVEKVSKKQCRVVDVNMTTGIDDFELMNTLEKGEGTTRFVTIMQGCDNYCTYCVVPFVRGPETSRHPDYILEEIHDLARNGIREITLLGQNVNSYGIKEGLRSFPELLAQINEIEGLQRIRFTTSHPKDLSEELIQAFQRLENLCPHIHLPIQSGSDRILKRMNRRYTRKSYIEKIRSLRDHYPDIAITSDFIVGFPGETESEFHESIELIKEVEFDSLFAFQYSDRPNASAARFSDKISESVKKIRLRELLEVQERITLKKHQSLVGSTQEILVEGISKQQCTVNRKEMNASFNIQWSGRTLTNKIVNFELDKKCLSCEDSFTGKRVQVKIDRAFLHSLWGRLIHVEPKPHPSKGEESYAA